MARPIRETPVLTGKDAGRFLRLMNEPRPETKKKMLFRMENKAGCRFITVDAYISAIPFYEHNGFLPLQQKIEDSSTNLLFYHLINADSI